MGKFDRQIATALKLIEENGQLIKWRIINDPVASDPTTPWILDEAVTEDKDAYICFLPVDRWTMQSLGFMPGTVIPAGLEMGLMGSQEFNPDLKDVVIRDGKELRIDTINILSPNGQPILYTMIFKQ